MFGTYAERRQGWERAFPKGAERPVSTDTRARWWEGS